MKRHALLVLALGFVMAADAPKDDVKKEQEKTNGTWQVTAFEADGTKMSEDEAKQFKVTLDGDKYTLKNEDNVVSKGTIKLDPTKKPKTIDITPIEGDNKGQVMLGIYELDGETMKTCYAQPGQERPKKFSAESGSGLTLIVSKKQKP